MSNSSYSQWDDEWQWDDGWMSNVLNSEDLKVGERTMKRSRMDSATVSNEASTVTPKKKKSRTHLIELDPNQIHDRRQSTFDSLNLKNRPPTPIPKETIFRNKGLRKNKSFIFTTVPKKSVVGYENHYWKHVGILIGLIVVGFIIYYGFTMNDEKLNVVKIHSLDKYSNRSGLHTQRNFDRNEPLLVDNIRTKLRSTRNRNHLLNN